MLPAEIGVLQIEIGPDEKTGNPLFETSLQLKLSVVCLDGFPFITVIKCELVQGGTPVEDEEDRPEFRIAAHLIRLFLYFGDVEFVLFCSRSRSGGLGFSRLPKRGLRWVLICNRAH